MKSKTLNSVLREEGFTIIEMMVVLVILSIFALAAVPRMTSYFSSKRENFAIMTGYIAKTFDDAFLNNHTNFLVLHLYEPGAPPENEEENEERAALFAGNNGLSVINFFEGKFQLNDRKVLKPRELPDSFRISKVLLADGREFATGSVIIPFYPQGYSSDVLVYIIVNEEEQWTIKIKKYQKEAEVIEEHVDFEHS